MSSTPGVDAFLHCNWAANKKPDYNRLYVLEMKMPNCLHSSCMGFSLYKSTRWLLQVCPSSSLFFTTAPTMPTIQSPTSSLTMRATDVPQEVDDALLTIERSANPILPLLRKARGQESTQNAPPAHQFWLWIKSNGSIRVVFAWMAAEKLYQSAIPNGRIYSVFAPKPLALRFSEEWTKLTGFAPYREPYYDAKITFCTPQDLPPRSQTVDPDYQYEIRPANIQDLEGVAALCLGFSETNAPFHLDLPSARREAQHLIRNQQVWVHYLHRTGVAPTLACIAAHTRDSENIATITKVYTSESCRRRGCAERLVRRLCEELFKTKREVTLYVGNDNPAAKVYRRVGFRGLGPSEVVEGVEPWAEIGFDRNQVVLGYW
ncbi:hypothetical protein DL96DRAFT_1600910 [Flagelloscypha sp. PMI_526]|nr:hypothetical protein DL96DRAFT_1600910 [Flagelloscypha sp. PMI_526]